MQASAVTIQASANAIHRRATPMQASAKTIDLSAEAKQASARAIEPCATVLQPSAAAIQVCMTTMQASKAMREASRRCKDSLMARRARCHRPRRWHVEHDVTRRYNSKLPSFVSMRFGRDSVWRSTSQGVTSVSPFVCKQGSIRPAYSLPKRPFGLPRVGSDRVRQTCGVPACHLEAPRWSQ